MAEPDLAVGGPLARSAADLELAFDVLAGPDAMRGKGRRLALPPARRERLADFRVACWFDDDFYPIDADTCRLLEDRTTLPFARLLAEHFGGFAAPPDRKEDKPQRHRDTAKSKWM